MLSSSCAICGKKKLTFIKNKELNNFNDYFRTNKIINAFLLTGYKFLPELHVKQLRFTYFPSGTFTKHRERTQKFRKKRNLKHFYRNELDKASFAYDEAYSDTKDLAKRTISDKVLKDKVYYRARICNFDGYQRVLASRVYKSFDKKTRPEISVNEQLAEVLHKPASKKLQNSSLRKI